MEVQASGNQGAFIRRRLRWGADGSPDPWPGQTLRSRAGLRVEPSTNPTLTRRATGGAGLESEDGCGVRWERLAEPSVARRAAQRTSYTSTSAPPVLPFAPFTIAV